MTARVGIDWGFYGVPETFIVRGDGVIAYKVIGPINAETLDSIVKPEFAKVGSELEIQILGERKRATVLVDSPYDPENKDLRA